MLIDKKNRYFGASWFVLLSFLYTSKGVYFFCILKLNQTYTITLYTK